MLSPFALTAGLVATLMLSVWALSLAKRDASIVDVAWGLGFVLIAAATCAVAEGPAARRALITAMTTLWGLRLAVYLLWRKWGEGEDFRYQAMRRQFGTRFPLVSLVVVFGLQGVLMWVVSLPLQVGQLSPLPLSLTRLDAAGAVVWAVGFLFEAVGDWQLLRFKGDPANTGRVMNRGLWRYTRHPNYFGDAVMWWGFYLVAAATPHGVWTIVSPIVMTFLLMRVSGVPLLERKLAKTRPEYRDYIESTSSFLPWPPRRRLAPQ